MANKTKKIISLILSLLMIFSTVSVAFAAESEVTVNIISFMRGEQANLRSSELLEAHVDGYDGNVQELTYKWYNSLGTYLYVYNSHNMYNINNTDGEIEIYNKDKGMSTLGNMEGRNYANSFAGVGYAWASVYGAGISGTSLAGTVTVEVYDKEGKLLCSDKHEGKYSNKKNTGFVTHNLANDMDNVVIGLFEGDKRNVKDLLGESAILHITCTASTVADGKVRSGGEHIKLDKSGDYYITGIKAGTSTDSNGDAEVDLKVTKSNCKFHQNTSGTATTTVFVFKRPTTETTTTTLTLTGNLDSRCDYFIGGVEGTKQSDGTIIFTGLTPNTPYSVEVRGEYKDNNNATKYAYAYVYDTTKPIYKATVKTYLDGVITDISDIHGEDVSLYLHEDKENADYIELTKDGVGTYSAEVVNGVYFPWHIEAGDHYHQAREYKLIVENANAELNLHHYSVKYYYDETAFSNGEELAKDIFSSGASVKVAADVPVREGYIFAGWKYDSNIYTSGEEVTSSIYAPISLVAQWEKAVNVTVNVTIDHTGTEGGYDHNANKDELLVEFLEMPAGAPAFAETGDKLNFSKEGVTDENGYSKDYTCTEEITNGTVLKTIYKADSYTYTGLLDSSEFGATVSKSGYDVLEVKKTKLENGDWEIDISLRYNPDDFDLGFSVKMADDVPKELYPDAVIVKIACWDETANEWIIISQQRTTDKVRPGVRVDIDKTTGEGSGAYPVWKHQSDGSVYGYRAVVTGFIYKDSTIIVPTEKDHSKDGEVIITYTDGNYTAIMGNVDDGQRFSTSLNGAYYNDALDAQQGTLDAVITIEKYDVTFDAQGGKVNGKEKDIAEKQYYVPSFDAYKPTMSEHNFLGWYLDAACTEPATEGVLLTEDITVYAKWDKILTGTLIVDGYYDSEHPVDDADRAKYALIELEEITDDGTYNIAGQTVTINWNTEDHFSEKVNYKFTGLDPNKTYRIDVYLTNYTAFYQNSTTVINGNDDLHDDYNDKDYTAIYPETSKLETFVNTFLHFEPEEYMLNVEVDSTALGEAFRPEDALVKYYSEEVGVNDEYILIVQHKDENSGVHVGIDKTTGLNDAIYGDYIWKKNYTGNLYNYQADLAKLDGKALSEWPVIVYYGDSVRWSPLNQAPTDSLKVTIIPMWYKVIYDLNGATDIDGNEKIEVARGHYWSHESELDKSLVPIRPGYDFGGWYSDPECTTGKEVTVISADVAADTTVYAKWIAKSDCVLTIEHIDSNTLEFLDVEVRGSQTHDTVINATDMVKDFKGYTYVSASADSITIDANNTANLLKLYYTANEYEYTVNYLEEGTDKILVPSKTGTAVYGTQAVETAVVVKGYSVSGDSTKTITIDTENNVINFYYTLDSYDYTVKYLEEGTNKPLADDKTASAGYGDSITETAAEINGYILTDDSSKTITIDTANNVIIFYYKAGSYDYTVKYLEEGTGKTLADDKTETATYGAEVTESAVAIEGYSISGDSTKSIKIDTENNAIIFYYTAYSCDYTVNYLEKDTNKVLSAAKKSSAKYGEIITETARAILGYTLADVSSKTITVDIANNVINFYYTANDYTYTVNYLEEGTGKTLADDKTETATYGAEVTESAIVIDGYIVSGYNTKSITIDAENNVITFYYAKRADLEFKVNYVDKDTNEVLSTETKTAQTFGDVITAESLKKEFKGYSFVSASAESVTIGTGVNEITLYYVRNSYSYTVNYLEEGTNKVLAEPKTAEAAFGESVTETVIAIDGYMSVGATQQTITISDDGNIINFYYTADKIGDGDNSDGIPDKYQKKVIFRVVNGTWADGTTENIVEVLNLMKGDSFSADGTATLTAPKNMKPNAGYGDGEWTITPPATVKGTNTVTYTYTFEKKPYDYEIEGSDTITMYEEETVQTEIKLVPDKGTDPNTLPTVVKYESADESIAIVDQNGKITGVKKGRTTVTATLSDGNTYTIHVIVKEREKMTVVFGKTEGIGWYRVSEDGGATYRTVFGNSTIEVKQGTQLIIKAGDLMGDAFTFYVNGNAVTPDENNSIVVTVDGYMLIGALGLTIIVPDVEESLNWFQKIIKAIKDFFARLFGKK